MSMLDVDVRGTAGALSIDVAFRAGAARRAFPYAFSYTRRPSCTTAIEALGDPLLARMSLTAASIWAAVAPPSVCEAAGRTTPRDNRTRAPQTTRAARVVRMSSPSAPNRQQKRRAGREGLPARKSNASP